MGSLAKITTKGQITLPKDVRDPRHALKPGDRIEFVEEDGKTWVRPRNLRAVDLIGTLGSPPNGSKTLDEIEEGIAEGWAETRMRVLE